MWDNVLIKPILLTAGRPKYKYFQCNIYVINIQTLHARNFTSVLRAVSHLESIIYKYGPNKYAGIVAQHN
jgi:hypothetical protein